MKIPTLPFTVTGWSGVAATTHPGVTGQAFWRTLDIGDLRVLILRSGAFAASRRMKATASWFETAQERLLTMRVKFPLN